MNHSFLKRGSSLFFIVLSLIPLVVGIKLILLDGHEMGVWSNFPHIIDLFSFYKSRLILFITPIFFLFSVLQINNFKVLWSRQKKILILSFIFLISILLSSFISKYPQTAWLGIPDRFEGGLVWICYIFIFLSIISSESNFKKLFSHSFTALIIAEFTIGFLQYFSLDPFQSSWVQRFISFGQAFETLPPIEFDVGKYVVYGTLYHYNYFGSFLALVLPWLGMKSFFEKSRLHQLLFAFGIFFVLVCGSRAGIIGSLFGLCFIFIRTDSLNVSKFRRFKPFIILTIFSILLAVAIPQTRDRLESLANEIQILAQSKNQASSLQELQVKQDEILLQIKEKRFKILLKDNNYAFFDESGHRIQHRLDSSSGKVSFNTDYLSDIHCYFLKLKEEKILAIHHESIKLGFVIHNGRFYTFDLARKNINFEQLHQQSHFEIPFSFASGRGYIWTRTIQVIFEKPLWGYGADTFLYVFPVGDIIGRFQTYGDTHTFVDKAHNLYLQVAVNFGLMGLFFFLAILFFSFTKKMNSLLLPSLLAYLIAGFFNDSLVSLGPIFWIMLGLVHQDHVILNHNQTEI